MSNLQGPVDPALPVSQHPHLPAAGLPTHFFGAPVWEAPLHSTSKPGSTLLLSLDFSLKKKTLRGSPSQIPGRWGALPFASQHYLSPL